MLIAYLKYQLNTNMKPCLFSRKIARTLVDLDNYPRATKKLSTVT